MMLPTAGLSPGQTCGAVLAAAVLLQSVCVAVTFLYFTNELKQVGAGRDGARARRRLCPLVRGSRGRISVWKPRWALWGAEEVLAAAWLGPLPAQHRWHSGQVVLPSCVRAGFPLPPAVLGVFLGCPTQTRPSCCTVLPGFASPGAKVDQAAGVCATLKPCQKILHECKHILPACLFHAKFNRWSLLKCQNSLCH